jgi:hypothetical protein
VTVSEVGIPTSPPTRSARILVDKRANLPAPASIDSTGIRLQQSGMISTDTAITLVNPTDAVEAGTLELFDENGAPLTVTTVGGMTDSSFAYSIAAQGAYVLQTNGASAEAAAGWAVATPSSGSPAPIGAGVFQLSTAGVLVTEAGVPAATPTQKVRIYVDRSAGHDTGWRWAIRATRH